MLVYYPREKAEIMMLIGGNLTVAHHVLDQKVAPGNLPYAQKLHLGWTIIGETCLGKVHQPNVINTVNTSNGRPSVMLRCDYAIHVKENFVEMTDVANVKS